MARKPQPPDVAATDARAPTIVKGKDIERRHDLQYDLAAGSQAAFAAWSSASQRSAWTFGASRLEGVALTSLRDAVLRRPIRVWRPPQTTVPRQLPHPDVALFLEASDVIDVQPRHGVTKHPGVRDLPQYHDEAADLRQRRPGARPAGARRGGRRRSCSEPRRPQEGARTSKASESEGLKTFEPALAAVARRSLYVHARMHALLDKKDSDGQEGQEQTRTSEGVVVVPSPYEPDPLQHHGKRPVQIDLQSNIDAALVLACTLHMRFCHGFEKTHSRDRSSFKR